MILIDYLMKNFLMKIKFQKIAKEAKAVRKVKGYCLVNTKLVEEYIESTYGEGENDDGKYEK